jgi:phospholipid/cholesterol/gamma-HCH transport system substrate-binding protein
MESSRSTELRVGIVSVLALALLIAGIMLGKGLSFSDPTNHVVITTTSSGGVEPGAPVVVRGVKRGRVLSVQNVPGGVEITVEMDNVTDISRDATALVTMLEITGGKKVEIAPGNSQNPLQKPYRIKGSIAADIPQLVTDVGEISGDAKMLVRRLDTIAASATLLLSDGVVVNNVRQMTSDGALLMTSTNQWFQENKGSLQRSVRMVEQLVEDLRGAIQRNEPRVAALLAKLDSTLSAVQITVVQANNAVVRADTLLASVQGVVHDVRTNKSLLNAVLYDEKLMPRLDSTISTLQEFLKSAQRHGVNVNVGLGQRP